jgi:hypothetical protein
MNASAPTSSPQSSSKDEKEKKTIWMGELETWMDEHYLRGIWWQFTKQQVNVKVIRDKFTGYIISNNKTVVRVLLCGLCKP